MALRRQDVCPRVHAELEDPGGLADSQRRKLGRVKSGAGSHLFRAWEPEEDLRAVFRAKDAGEARRLLEKWLREAACCRTGPMVAVEKKVRRRKEDVIAAVELGVGNGRTESANDKVKVTVKAGHGLRNADNLVSLLMLRRSDVRPRLPGRPDKEKKAARRGALKAA